jgi:protocatechuate 3,4-dioxygenase beta subunit
VRNKDDQTPVEGAKVHLYVYSSPPTVLEKTTGAGGIFQADTPPAIRYGVKVEAEGFRPYQEDSFVITRPYFEMEILLTPALTLRGRVIDDLANGVADALVQLRRANAPSPLVIAATTDRQGGFKITDVPQPGSYSIEASHPGFDALGIVNVTIPAASEAILRMRQVQPAGSLSGVVTDSSRKPVAGAAISLTDPRNNRALSQIQTDVQGMYRFPTMREGYYAVSCFAEGYSQPRTGAVTISADKETRLDFTLESGSQIRGVVVNQKNEPVLQAQVMYVNEEMQLARSPVPDGMDPMAQRIYMRDQMQRARTSGVTSTDSEGRFQISGVPDSQYRIIVTHRDYLSLVTSLRPSSQLQTLTLDGGLSLRGTVSNVQGAAVDRFTLTFQSTSSRNEKSYSFTSTDGHFEIRGLARDVYQVVLQPGGRERYSGMLDLQASTEIYVVLDPSSGGRGTKPLIFQKTR